MTTDDVEEEEKGQPVTSEHGAKTAREIEEELLELKDLEKEDLEALHKDAEEDDFDEEAYRKWRE